MKVISLLQPWATLVVIGAKRFETRSWSTQYRGPLLIHASKKFTKDDRELCKDWPFSEYIMSRDDEPPYLHPAYGGELATGKIIGKVELLDCLTTENWRVRYSQSESKSTQEEYRFGNYGAGRFAWEMRNPTLFSKPIPAKGSLGLWEFDP